MKNRLIYRRVLYSFLPLLGVASLFSGGCSSKPPQPGPPVITKEEVHQLKIGMTLAEAQKIVGSSGQPMGGSPPLTSHIWTNDDGSLVTVTFLNGKIQQISPGNFK